MEKLFTGTDFLCSCFHEKEIAGEKLKNNVTGAAEKL
jgi:hypothetical protein